MQSGLTVTEARQSVQQPGHSLEPSLPLASMCGAYKPGDPAQVMSGERISKSPHSWTLKWTCYPVNG